MQVDFTSVFAMEHTGMARMFKSLEDTGLKGFLAATISVFESIVVEFFANAKVVAGTVISSVALAVTKEVLLEAFGLPTEGIEIFWIFLIRTVVEMRGRFSSSDVPFRAPSKKKEMKMEFRLLHDIVSKALCVGGYGKQPYPSITGFCGPAECIVGMLGPDGLEIKIDVLESTLVHKLADNQQNIAALETGLVRHFADSQQHILDEFASLKSQVAEMVDCLKELRDAKKGEGPSNKKGEGTRNSKKRRWF
ncbi:hypothetical protein F511_28985 [Dorcoceras hygrometricum]|uniref:Uncharacterized protein n=1 Tax=Dorcoceras hygrometricum TaxID=472368 RepID=A0A2Z7C4D1_9LAMI|nr:hypothetical protein F511_28985 [Dorcoceras hygrometricum]